MLEDLNSVLNNGDVPNIYKTDEMEKIFHSMRGHAQEAGLQINRSNLFSVYVKTVRNNLHVVVTMRYSFPFFLTKPRLFRRIRINIVGSYSGGKRYVWNRLGMRVHV